MRGVNMYQKIKFGSLALALYILSISIFALPSDREQTLHIFANSSFFNYKTGIDIYEGDVKVDQGSTHLTGDRLITKKNAKRKIISAIAYGIKKRAIFKTEPKSGDKPLIAMAKIIKLYPETSLVMLEEDVNVAQGENSFHGPIIIYNMKDQVVSIPPSKNGRATIIINPKPLKSP